MIISLPFGVGFFGDFCTVLRHLSIAEKENTPLYVYWNNISLYYDSQVGNNAWEYYFYNTSTHPNELGIKEYNSRKDVPDLVCKDNMNFRETMNYLINKYIKLVDSVQIIIDDIQKKISQHNTLGIHIRKTDKMLPHLYGEPTSPIDNDVYIEYANSLIKKYNFDKVFLATDDTETLDLFKKEYKNKILYTNSFRSTGNISIHGNHKNISGYKKGLDVLIDCLALSKCNFLLRGTSNVSATAQFFNLYLKHINLNELLSNDCRENDFNLKTEKL